MKEPPDHYDTSVRLVQLLCLAVEKLGGELEVPADFDYDPEHPFRMSWTRAPYPNDAVILRVKRET